MTTATPLSIGWRAARANFWPGLCLQVVMALVVVAYFRVDWARQWFDQLAILKARGGFLFSMSAAALAGALLPAALGFVFFRRERRTERRHGNLRFGMIFWAVMGLIVDLFYRGQSFWFGSEVTVSVLAKKVAVDQFIYTPFFAAPVTVWCFEWKNRGYRTNQLRELFRPEFYARKILPTLVANWGVWIPATALIYSLPPLLQIPLFNLALTFWALMVAHINADAEPTRDALPAPSDKVGVTRL